ncbi:hypothetical protein CBR_g26518 [Chara braunii]|uniref:Uncharacterized protein n=1 Tax=Chara braunii TaxID=69332 RepID=A0A388L853_CHABU|nr:hypothetical protein CBR_g26518 [Chara braunii]|eukprot:GBG78490.1 hypothetical protein CBR_g26518 [Chara braunii]
MTLNEASKKVMEKKISTAILFFDFEKAYDQVNWEFLDASMERMGVSSNLRKWVRVLYNNASGCVQIKGLRRLPNLQVGKTREAKEQKAQVEDIIHSYKLRVMELEDELKKVHMSQKRLSDSGDPVQRGNPITLSLSAPKIKGRRSLSASATAMENVIMPERLINDMGGSHSGSSSLPIPSPIPSPAVSTPGHSGDRDQEQAEAMGGHHHGLVNSEDRPILEMENEQLKLSIQRLTQENSRMQAIVAQMRIEMEMMQGAVNTTPHAAVDARPLDLQEGRRDHDLHHDKVQSIYTASHRKENNVQDAKDMSLLVGPLQSQLQAAAREIRRLIEERDCLMELSNSLRADLHRFASLSGAQSCSFMTVSQRGKDGKRSRESHRNGEVTQEALVGSTEKLDSQPDTGNNGGLGSAKAEAREMEPKGACGTNSGSSRGTKEQLKGPSCSAMPDGKNVQEVGDCKERSSILFDGVCSDGKESASQRNSHLQPAGEDRGASELHLAGTLAPQAVREVRISDPIHKGTASQRARLQAVQRRNAIAALSLLQAAKVRNYNIKDDATAEGSCAPAKQDPTDSEKKKYVLHALLMMTNHYRDVYVKSRPVDDDGDEQHPNDDDADAGAGGDQRECHR